MPTTEQLTCPKCQGQLAKVFTGQRPRRRAFVCAKCNQVIETTIRASRTMDEFQQAFIGRIAALSKPHSLLTENQQKHVPLTHVLNNELSIYEDGAGQRVMLSGPEAMLPAHVSVSFAMAIHELTTNALKYGALSVLRAP